MKEGLGFKDKFTAKVDPPPDKQTITAADVGQMPDSIADAVDADRMIAEALSHDPTRTPAHAMTLAQHLARGKEVCEEKQRRHHAYTQRLADARYRHWSALMDAAVATFGEELTGKATLPVGSTKFTMDTESWELELRPFNRATFTAKFACKLRKKADHVREYEEPWAIAGGVVDKPYTVRQDYRPGADGVYPNAETGVRNASEAVHLCYLQSDGYDDAERRYNEMKLRDRNEMAGESAK